MDLADLDLTAAADNGAALTLRHPVTDEDLTDDKGNPMTITVLGSDSGAFKRILADLQKRSQARKKAASVAEVERNTVDILVAITTGWTGLVWDGKPLAFSAENARKVYTERPWIRSQVDEFIADRSNFFGKA